MSISRGKAKEDSITMLNALYQQIADTAEGVVPLYDAIEDFFFQDVDYQKIKSIIPLWMMDAGRSPESGGDKGLYEQLRSVYNDPISNRIIHWADSTSKKCRGYRGLCSLSWLPGRMCVCGGV